MKSIFCYNNMNNNFLKDYIILVRKKKMTDETNCSHGDEIESAASILNLYDKIMECVRLTTNANRGGTPQHQIFNSLSHFFGSLKKVAFAFSHILFATFHTTTASKIINQSIHTTNIKIHHISYNIKFSTRIFLFQSKYIKCHTCNAQTKTY
jgi:hypothetical protein